MSELGGGGGGGGGGERGGGGARRGEGGEGREGGEGGEPLLKRQEVLSMLDEQLVVSSKLHVVPSNFKIKFTAMVTRCKFSSRW